MVSGVDNALTGMVFVAVSVAVDVDVDVEVGVRVDFCGQRSSVYLAYEM